MWNEGFFKSWQSLPTIVVELGERGNNFSSVEICKALLRTKYLTRRGKRGAYEYIQKMDAIRKEVEDVEHDLFPVDLVVKFGKKFNTEITDLRLNFGKSGNCTAFLLRKILEKAIFLAFAKNGNTTNLEDRSGTGRLIGLEAMLDTAAREKVGGIPFLLPRTAEKIRGAKFLGDTSAHNPLANVDMETILPQMPFVITAYKELAERL